MKTTSKPEAFEAFWSIYPRRVGRGAAEVEFAKALKRASFETIMEGLMAQLPANLKKSDPQFIPHARTWLHQSRWRDDVEHPIEAQPRGIAGAAIRSMGNAGQNQGGYRSDAQLVHAASKH